MGEELAGRPLDRDPDRATALCREAHARLLATAGTVDDATITRSSLLPGWTVGHVLTHLARNADAHARRVGGALHGEDVPKYERGPAQRAAEIEAGAHRPAAEIRADLAASTTRLDSVLAAAVAAEWPHGHLRGGGGYGVTACPAHRLREVEQHHVDLGLGYTPDRWPDEYVAWDLPVLLQTLPGRIESGAERRALLAWMAGRRDGPPPVVLSPW